MELILLLGNVIFIALSIIFWMQLASLKKSSSTEISDLKQKLEEDIRELNAAETQMREAMMADSKKIETLMNEISEARHQKGEEMKLRLEAEKQIALAIQKAEDIQKRMHDWKSAQEAAMKDSQNTIIKVGEDLYQKINASYQEEIANSKSLFEKVTEYIKKAAIPAQTQVQEAAATSRKEPKAEAPAAKSSENNNDIPKKLASDLVQSMKESNHVEGEKYFISQSFDAAKAKMFLCEAAFLQDNHFYIFDFKACGFLNDYTLANDKDSAQRLMTQKLDKYIAYLSNPKYRNAILKAAESKHLSFESGDVIVIVPSHAELEALETTGYLEKLEEIGAKVATYDEIID